MSNKTFYVTAVDEEGFNTHIIGPFSSRDEADSFVDVQRSSYEGHCQEPYQALPVTAPENFDPS